MVDAGIDDGDRVVIRMDCEAKVGDIVVALLGDNESTLKAFGGIDAENQEDDSSLPERSCLSR